MGRDDRSVRRAGPADDLGAPRRPAGQVADRRTAADRDRLGDGTGLLPERGPRDGRRRARRGRLRDHVARPQAVRAAGTIRHPGDRGARVPSSAHARRRLRRDLEGHARRAARAVRRLVGRGRRIARGAGRDRRLPPRAGVPLPRRAGSGRRTRAAAGRRGRSAPRGRGRAGVRSQRLHGVGQPPLSGLRVAGSRRSDCGSASCRISGLRSSEAGDMDGARATFDEAIERAARSGR